MSVFTNFPKVAHHIWDKITTSPLAAYFAKVEQDAERVGKQVLLDGGKAALLKAKEELTTGATGGDLIKAAAEILIATLKTEGHTALVGLAFNIISTLYVAAESHEA